MLNKCKICDKEYSSQRNDKQVCPECLLEISKEFLSIDEINKKEKEIKREKYWNDFINGTLVINCETKQEAINLCTYLHKKKFKWKNKYGSLKDNAFWYTFCERTCYKNYSNGIDNYSTTHYRNNHQIIKYKDIFD